MNLFADMRELVVAELEALMAEGVLPAGLDLAGVAVEPPVPSATRRMELSAEAQLAALRQLGEEYQHPALGWFDRMVDGLNRLPRPLLAFGTIGLFVYAMIDPVAFATRMVGLNAVPEPLWWLLGAIVAFYFGARETHYFRSRAVVSPIAGQAPPEDNAALEDWRQG